MASVRFDTTPEDWVADQNGNRIPNATVTFWTSQTGGTQVTTLVPDGGTDPVTSMQANDRAQVPAFTDPNGTYTGGVWADGTADGSLSGYRTLIVPTDTGSKLADLTAQVSSLQTTVNGLSGNTASQTDLTALTTRVTNDETTLNQLQTQVNGLGNQVPTLEELLFVRPIDSFIVSNALAVSTSAQWFKALLTAAIPVTVQAISIVWDNFTQAGDASNYWTADLRKFDVSANVFTTIATISTQSGTANYAGPIVHDVEWNFDSAVFSDRALAKGDKLQIRFTPTGSPAAMVAPLLVVVRYAPS